MKFWKLVVGFIFLLAGCSGSRVIMPEETVTLEKNQAIVVFRINRADDVTVVGRMIIIKEAGTGETHFFIIPELGKPKQFPVLKVIALPAGKYFFDSLDITEFGDGGTTYKVNISPNSFVAEAGKVVYIGDLVVKSRVTKSFLKGKEGTFWYRLNDRYEEVKTALTTQYPNIVSNYTLEKRLAEFKNTLFDWREVDISDVKITPAKGTMENPVLVEITISATDSQDNEELFWVNLLTKTAEKRDAAIFSYISSVYGEENKGWFLIEQKVISEKKLTECVIYDKSKNEQTKIYFKISYIEKK
ncbi:hypothetical protein BREVNS_1176 [Brevinematales bacterium NS]|nr:hypothetical protein BREVNS_1176 [Brevinematales bacterium NS]